MTVNVSRTIFFLLFFLLSCSRQHELPKSKDGGGDVPLQEFTGTTTVTLIDSGRVEWVLTTPHMTREWSDEKTHAEPIVFDYYGGKKEPVSHLTANRGMTQGKNIEKFYVEGRVRIRSKKGFKLRAQNLHWNKKTNRITSDGRVRFTTRSGDVLKGRGFRSDPDLDNWEILHDVQGEFQNFKKRMDKGRI